MTVINDVPPLGPDPDDLRWTHRCTLQYGEDALPHLPGDVADQTWHKDHGPAIIAATRARDRVEIGRILIEQRHPTDVTAGGTGDEWRVLHTWTRTPDGWEYR
jgi:hypothetical protein